ncbi:DEAD/DEAH box helicase [Treponema phagedenis]|uniref:DEAD/DEAH box helicase n=1 Tax=Treponema phagedenis TaxID=162 RepID=UPI0004672B9E|nr:DEAD/DEAH box helicase [Treponema phagedenis]
MAKKEYGVTPWGAWFLEMLEAYNGTGRITRGKTYANTGKVDSLNIKENSVGARVEGRYEPWYYISIKFPALSGTNFKKLEVVFKKNPIDLVSLRAGTMSPNLLKQIKDKNIRLIPSYWRYIERDCTCPDSGDPCKHMAAVLYILAKEIDHDPRLLFQLAGVDLSKIEIADSAYGEAPDAEDSENDTPAEKSRAVQKESAFASGQEVRSKHPVPLSLRKPEQLQVHDGSADDQTNLTAQEGQIKTLDELLSNEQNLFSSGESYLTLITSMLPKETSFYSGNLIAAFTDFYHTSIKTLQRDFYLQNTALFGGSENENTLRRISYAQVRINDKELIQTAEDFPLKTKKFLTVNVILSGKTAHTFTLYDASLFFANVQPAADSPQSVKELMLFFKLAKKIINDSAFAPALLQENKRISLFWKALTASSEIQKAVAGFASIITEDFFAPVKVWGKAYSAEIILTVFLTEYVQRLRYTPRSYFTIDTNIVELFFSGAEINIQKPGLRNLGTVIENWLSVLHYANPDLSYRLVLRENSKDENFTLQALVLLKGKKVPRYVDLYKAYAIAENPDEIFHFPAMLSAYLPQLAELAKKKSVVLTKDETASFLKNAAKLLTRFGVEVVLPKELQKALVPRPVIKVEKIKGAGPVQSYLGIEAVIQYDRAIMLGDTVISIPDFLALMKQSSSLVKFKDRFVLIDPEQVALMLSSIKKEKPSLSEVLQGTFTGESIFSDEIPFFNELKKETDIPLPEGIQATLRPYQLKGYRWLYSNLQNGFGCLLGDDMGLGKTLQVICLCEKLKEESGLPEGILIVAPASLLTNWQHEIKKFAPQLSVKILHGKDRSFTAGTDIHITTYQTLQRDAKKITDKTFDCLIIDEAQAIKNANTKNAKALRSLNAKAKIALTGTPIENSLEDMRSIFDFLLPGYLGSAEAFKKKWRIPIELHNDIDTAENLKKITSPFLLRRLKTDPKVISDLPEKIISPQYCTLTPQQVAIYESLIRQQLKTALNAKDSIQRSAFIVKLLTALKQVCNHPRTYDKISPPDINLSGKMLSLIILLKEILTAGEKTLIFSQYTETLFLLKEIIKAELDEDCLLLHGQMPARKRQQNVTAFQTEPDKRIFLISLKAGGTGLNLTAASRVIHFDLWYNPAVEDQATDRAFRIGQQKHVFVHRFICAGTFEEKIDEMIQRKRAVSDKTLGTGETWIAKMSDEELDALFSI